MIGDVMSDKTEIEKHAKQNSKLVTENRETQDIKPKTLDPQPETLLLAGPDFLFAFTVSGFRLPVWTT